MRNIRGRLSRCFLAAILCRSASPTAETRLIVAVLRFYGSVTLPPWQIFVGLSSLMFTFAATLTLTALIAKGRGYRLISGLRKAPEIPVA